MKHFALPEFWLHHRRLPEPVRELADKNFALLKTNPRHPSIRLKKVGTVWSARIGLHYRGRGRGWIGLALVLDWPS